METLMIFQVQLMNNEIQVMSSECLLF